METDTNIFSTIAIGFTIFTLGQIFLKMVIEPVQNLKTTISEIAFTLANYYLIFHNVDVVDKEHADSAFDTTREFSYKLHAEVSLIPFYTYSRHIFRLPSKEKIEKASEELLYISNTIFSTDDLKCERIDKNSKNVFDFLNINISLNKMINREKLHEQSREQQ